MSISRSMTPLSRTLLGAVALVALLPIDAFAAAPINTSRLRQAVTVKGIQDHNAFFQRIANQNGGTRAASTPGYDLSANYVAAKMRTAGYRVTVQPFDFPFFQELSDPEFEQISPNPTVYELHDDEPIEFAGFASMELSGSGDTTAPITRVDLVLPPPPVSGSTSGCEAADFAGFPAGNIALIQRGTCDFVVKAANAQAAGASGVIIFNEGQPGRQETLFGTLGSADVTIPVIGTAFSIGDDLAALAASGAVTARVKVDAISEIRSTTNVIAESRAGRTDRVIVVGAHLDSVEAGPGINDNGSGSSTILEIALEMAQAGITPRNRLRFAWWGAEESGLHGSNFYVANLDDASLDRVALNLNFDMVGSPNYVRFVYDGDGSEEGGAAGPEGSDAIEAVFEDFFDQQGQPTEGTLFDGRSDYRAFILAGIPAGGLFTGAEELKTAEQATIFGGTAGVAFDHCYHQACDTFANVSTKALDEMSDAAAHAIMTFAMTQGPLFPEPIANRAALARAAGVGSEMEYLGHLLAK
jgi:Zn-dependent M28 family amino/carboxypeptidase